MIFLLLSFLAQAADLTATVKFGPCSASFVTLENRGANQQGMVLTNGHCSGLGSNHLGAQKFPAFGEAFAHQRMQGLMPLLGPNASFPLVLDRLIYATMTGTDIALYRTRETYAEIKARTNIEPLVIAKNPVLQPGKDLLLLSAQREDVQTCTFDRRIGEVREEWAVWKNVLRLTGCAAEHGFSGSPVVLKGTKIVVGVQNTAYRGGAAACTFDNPCEVEGTIRTANPGDVYAQDLTAIYTCLDTDGEIDPSVHGCQLTQP